MAGGQYRINVHESGQTPGDSEGQASLERCSPRGCRVRRDLVTEQQQLSSYSLVTFRFFGYSLGYSSGYRRS